MTAQEKHFTIRQRLATRRPFIVTFTKRDGSLRTMRCQYEGGKIVRSMMQVFDLDKQAVRTINLNTVHTLGEIKERQDREPKPRSYADVKAELDQIFY